MSAPADRPPPQSPPAAAAQVGTSGTGISPDRPRRSGGLWYLGAAAAAVAYPALRPYADETTLEGARGMASGAWAAAHLCGMACFVLLAGGAVAVTGRLIGTAGERAARRAAWTTALGAALVLPYYGAETFGLGAIGARAAQDGDAALLVDLTDAVRYGAPQVVVFGAGLVLLAVGTVLLARALALSAARPRWAGAVLAAALVLYLPQFFAPPGLRIAHGVLLAVGAVGVAVALARQPRRSPAAEAAASV